MTSAPPEAIEKAAARRHPEDVAASAPCGARVEARDLRRRFGRHVALDGISLEIAPGETFGLLGANGAGKTTFIRLVTGYLLPTSGRVAVDGLSPDTDAQAVHARLGFVPETSRLYPDLRVRSFLRFCGGVRGMRGESLEAAVERVIARMALRTVADRLIGNLSKGYQQRVSLAQGFLHDPALLIVDEPTSGLDPRQRAEVRSILAEARGHRTVLLCTHDLLEARELAARIGILSRGRLVAVGPTAQVLGGENPLDLFESEDLP